MAEDDRDRERELNRERREEIEEELERVDEAEQGTGDDPEEKLRRNADDEEIEIDVSGGSGGDGGDDGDGG